MKHSAFEIVKGLDLSGKVYLVTGAYAGLGATTTQALLKAKATVIIAGRNGATQAEFAQQLKDDATLSFQDHQLDASRTLDLGDLKSVRDFACYVKEKYPAIDCLINNAGVMNTPPGKTKDGFETQFGVNVIGHFLLAKILVDITKRQVWLSSKGHIRYGAPGIDYDAITEVDPATYHPRRRYQQSKLGDILLAKYFDTHYPDLQAVSVHPGVVKTSLGRYMPLGKKLVFILKHPRAIMTMKSPEEGASTQVMVATVPASQLTGGAYYVDCKVTEEAESGRDMDDARKLFAYCEKVTANYQA